MVLKMYSVFDKKATMYGKPFFTHNDGMACRVLQDSLASPEAGGSTMRMHPADFCLYVLGSYDDCTGVVTGDNPVVVMEVSSLIVKDDSNDGAS